MAGAFDKFKVSSKKIGGSSKSSGIKRNPNVIELLIARDLMQQQKSERTTKGIGDVIGQVKQGLGKVPVDAKLHVGDSVSADVNLNPKLDDAEKSVMAANKVYPDIKRDAISLIKKGVFNSRKGLLGSEMFPDADRTVRQMASQQKSPLATFYDKDLQRVQSKLAKLKELMFERGGKALTPTEESIVGRAFIVEGKSDEQIIEDIMDADAIIEEKARLTLGGMNAAIEINPEVDGVEMPEQQEDDRFSKLQRIKDRFKQRNP